MKCNQRAGMKMGEVVKMQGNQDDSDLVQRFRKWWQRQDKETQEAIREIVNGDDVTVTKEQAAEVLMFLNLKTGRNYRAVETNLRKVRAILKTGVTVQQMKAVIAKKCRDWRGDEKMEQYLRPETLFRASKFENYLGEIGNE